MRALTVQPGRPGSDLVVDIPPPDPRPGEAVVQVLSVGICGTDREIVGRGYGEPPPGENHLILGHESLGRVVGAAGPLTAGRLVAAIVRRPDPVPCANCARGRWDMCSNGLYTERGIKGRHGFLCEQYAELPEYLVPVPDELVDVGALVEPASIVAKALRQIGAIQNRLEWEPREALVAGAGPIGLLAAAFLRVHGLVVTVYDLAQEGPKVELARALGCDYLPAGDGDPRDLFGQVGRLDVAIDATGHAPLIFDLIGALGPNGIGCLTGVSASAESIELAAASVMTDIVLDNKVVFGTVNASRGDFESAVRVLGQIEETWPGWLQRLVTRRVPLERYDSALDKEPHDVKVFIDL